VATAKMAAERASKAVDEISERYEEYWEHLHDEEDTMRSKIHPKL
jgi:flavin-dependent dehydrogenase